MEKNLGNIDVISRLIVSLCLMGMYMIDVLTGTIGIVLLVVAFVLTLTSALKFCPIFAIFKTNQYNKNNPKRFL